jgi:hypothetical protein
MRLVSGPIWPLSKAELERESKRQAARAKEEQQARERERAKYVAELDAEIDREIRAEREAAERPPVDAVQALEQRLQRDAIAKAAVARGEYPKLLPGDGIRAEDKRRRRQQREQREREQREHSLGLPKLQARYDARLREIDETCTQTIAENHERCREADQAAVDAKQQQRAELGERPSLESLEAKV